MTGKGKKTRLALAAIVLAGATSVACAAESAESLQARLDSKTRLVKLLLAQSPAVQRIPQSDNAQAKQKLADAQALYAKAVGEAQAGRLESAVKMLDQALLEIVSASRLVPDPAQLAVLERARYQSLSETTRTFLNLHKAVAARMEKKGGTPLDMTRINGLMSKAEGLAAGGNHKDAAALLNDAYKAIVASLNHMLMAETIVYDQKFAGPSEEFQHELARNRSYEELVPLALAQLNPARETAQLAERYVQQSKELRAAAQKQAAGGDYPSALKTIQDATGHLQRSLRIAGVVVPQSAESNP